MNFTSEIQGNHFKDNNVRITDFIINFLTVAGTSFHY